MTLRHRGGWVRWGGPPPQDQPVMAAGVCYKQPGGWPCACSCSQSAVWPHLRFLRIRRIWGRLRTQLPAITSHPMTTATAAASEGLAAVAAGAATAAAAAAAAATTVCRGRRAASAGMQRALRLAGAAPDRLQELAQSAPAGERPGTLPPAAVL
jgi:hypothetical protein